MITELYISHYKSIYEQTLDLRAINILVGKNGSGKSNIIDALSFLSDVANDDLDYAVTKRHGADSIRQWSKYKPYDVTIQVRVDRGSEGRGLYRMVLTSSRNNYRIKEEHLEWFGDSPYGVGPHISTLKRFADSSLYFTTDYSDYDDDDDGEEGTFDVRLKSEVSKIKLEGSESLLRYLMSGYSTPAILLNYILQELRSLTIFTIFPNTIRAPQSVSRVAVLESDGKNIASIIKQMTGDRRRNRDRIIKSLKAVLPQLSGINIRSAAGYYVPVFSVSDTGGEGHELNMAQVSDGTLRMLGILTALHQPQAPLKVALEEPEQMIHPALLVIVRDAVTDYVRRRKHGQVFITTHSAVLMDLFEVEDVIAVEYRDGSTKCSHVSRRQADIVKSGLMSLGEILLAEDLELG